MKIKKHVLTSVNVNKERFNEFKIECIKEKFTFTKLVDSCIDMYLHNREFRDIVHSHKVKE